MVFCRADGLWCVHSVTSGQAFTLFSLLVSMHDGVMNLRIQVCRWTQDELDSGGSECQASVLAHLSRVTALQHPAEGPCLKLFPAAMPECHRWDSLEQTGGVLSLLPLLGAFLLSPERWRE